MLRLRSLDMHNFGPYKGDQRIDFPDGTGVTIIYGDNMQGKSSLLNAFRYALLGQILTRGSKSVAIHEAGNWEAQDEGIFGFHVVLRFEVEGIQYVLTRQARPRTGVKIPKSDLDYIQDLFIQKDGSTLGPDQARAELEAIMPEQVVRFYLFDGELLQEYQELLANDSAMGRNISDAIERILGLPVLTSARNDVQLLYRDAEHRHAAAAQRSKNTQLYGNELEEATRLRAHHEDEVRRLEGDLRQRRSDRATLEAELMKNQQVTSLMDDVARVTQDIESLDSEIEKLRTNLQHATREAWRGVLAHRVRTACERYEAEIRVLEPLVARQMMAEELLQKTEAALAEHTCPTCKQTVSSLISGEILSNLRSTVGDVRTLRESQERLRLLTRQAEALRRVDAQDNRPLIAQITDSINSADIKRIGKEHDLKSLQTEIEGVDEDEVRRIRDDYDQVGEQILILQQGIKNEQSKIEEYEDSIRKAQAKLKQIGGADLTRDETRQELYASLHGLLLTGVSVYRSRLRERVEYDATRLFRVLTTEPDYDRLNINANYGLTIVHKDGRDIRIRSAGAEHIVALSLIGALHKNAPLQGPVIMDSPFGRLDRRHRTNVVRAFDDLSPQVIVLAFEDELPPSMARHELGANLRAEYHMRRISARHTQVVALTEADRSGAHRV